MKHFSLFLACTAACGIYSLEASAANNKKKERPNILWVTFEDTSSYEFGCYGNKDVHTPNADSLAAQGIQFMNAWSVAPQSSPARSSLITGCYAPTYGMDVHPVSYDTPADIFFPQRLREAGYYCTNNSKTHYNSTNNNKACWDECTKTASYNSPKRGKDQPFFAVFNTVTSHMGRVRTFHTDGRRDYTKEGIYTELLTLPSYVPDLPEVRSDYAGHLEAVQDVDTWLPEKWKHLANGKSGKDNSLVNFTDLGPTVLSLAGVKPTKNMQGKAIFGEYASKEERKVQFAFAANQLHHFMPVRAVTDGHIKYMRSYIPYRQFALRNYYQWGMPSNKAWDKLVLGNHNTNPDWALTFDAHPAEMLFDLDKDPGELHDLSSSPEYAEVLAKMRKELSNHIRSTHDLGFFLPTSRTGHVLYDVVRKEKYPMEELYKLVEAAGIGDIASLPLFEKAIASSHRDMRFWGAVGYAELAHKKQISQCPQALADLLKDEDPYVASEAAYAAAYLGKPQEGIARLINPAKEEDRKIGYSSLECISLDPTMRDYIRQFLPQLKEAAETLPRKKNEDSGLMARGILVNLGELDIKLLHGPEAYKEGLKLNHGRRPMVPLPY